MLHVKKLSPRNVSSRAAISSAVGQVLPFWSMVGIKTIIKHRAVTRLSRVYERWVNLKKSSSRPSDPGERRQSFRNSLEKLWDIGAPDATQCIQSNRLPSDKREEDIAFYKDQRGERKSSMSGMDEVSERNVKR